ncbi:MAG: molecular chaperone DnaJ [Chloroflexota bacterium]|jgi:curved DNA-binding protein CbpA|nr:molecular chaperone DnaJ [Chloroflexota bacterium]
MTDLYEVLQVHRRADPDVIRAAYRVLARKHHPDFGGDPARMVALNAAWRVLSDDARRTAYDEELRKSIRRRATDRAADAPIASYAPGAHGNGPATGRESGTVIDFGRYAGWSVGRLVSHDPDYLEWLARTPIGRRLAGEIQAVLAQRASNEQSLRPTGTSGHRRH